MANSDLQVSMDSDSTGYRTKADWAYLQLRRWIQGGALEPGQHLDQELLASRLHISRVPLRQALVRLESDGLIVSRPHIGATVAPLSLDHAEDIYASRGVLESMLAEVAVPHLNEAIVRDLESLVEAQQRAFEEGNRQRLLELDRQFHTCLYEQSGYTTSVELVGRLRDLSDRYVAAFQGSTERSSDTLEQHREILRACAAGDGKAAARLIKQHVEHGIEFLRQTISNEHQGR